MPMGTRVSCGMWTTVLQQDGTHHWEKSHRVTAQSDPCPLQCICAVRLFVKLSCKSWAAVTRGREEVLLNTLLLCETELQCQAGRQQQFFHGDCNWLCIIQLETCLAAGLGM